MVRAASEPAARVGLRTGSQQIDDGRLWSHLVPPGVIVCSLRLRDGGEPGDDADRRRGQGEPPAGEAAWQPLLAAERQAVEGAVLERVRSFHAGRHCAALALQRLGVQRAPILRGRSGEPVWPAGVVGSITHCRGYAAAAVSWAQGALALGIDVERARALRPGVRKRICTPRELAALERLPMVEGVPWEVVIFSAKESFYKAWFPVTGRRLGFSDVQILVDPPTGSFEVSLQGKPERGRECAAGIVDPLGRFAVEVPYVFTSVVVPAAAGAQDLGVGAGQGGGCLR